jgi:hypothetical protein
VRQRRKTGRMQSGQTVEIGLCCEPLTMFKSVAIFAKAG